MKQIKKEIIWTNEKGEKFYFEAEEKEEALKLTNYRNFSLSFEDLGNFLIFAENYCREKGKPILVIDDRIVSYDEMSFVKINGYRALWDLLECTEHQNIYPNDFLYGTWAKEIKKGRIEENFLMFKALREELISLKKEHPTFDYRMTYKELFLSYRGVEDQEIEISLNGTTADIIMSGKDEVYTVETKEEISETFQKLMKLLEQKTKIKNIFAPSKKYFDDFANRHISFKKEVKEEVYSALRKNYSANEIEDFCATKKDVKKRKKLKHTFSSKKDELLLFSFSNHFVIVENTKTKVEATLYETKKESKEIFEQKAEEIYKREISLLKQEIQQKLNKF